MTTEETVFVTGKGTVTRSPEGAAVALVVPPPTRTTEYDTCLGSICCCSLRDNGNEFAIVENIAMNDSIDTLSFMVKPIAANFLANFLGKLKKSAKIDG